MNTSIYHIGFGCIILLSIQQVAFAVICYSCINCPTTDSSTGTRNDDYCYTVLISLEENLSQKNRGAASECLTGHLDYGGVTGEYSCCSEDKCNGDNKGNKGLALSSSVGWVLVLVAVIHATKKIMIS